MSPWLQPEEFKEIFSKVPRLTVEVIVKSDKGIILTKRQIDPCKGSWHIPGVTVFYGEPVETAVQRVAKDELGTEVKIKQLLGYIEYPSHYKNGMDSPVGIALEVELPTGVELQEDAQWFTEIPTDMHPDQDKFLLDHDLLKWGQNSSIFPHTGVRYDR